MGSASLLNGYSDWDKYGLLFDNQCVKNLEHLINATQAAVVISSSWRYEGWDTMQEMWKVRAMSGFLLGMTTIDESLDSRVDEIAIWLEENLCERYVILDDVDDFLATQRKQVVLTDYKNGFEEKELKKAIALLQ